jgi:sugar lactone lactonase YvrE
MNVNKIISNIKSELGEGIFYDSKNDSLLWVDINKLQLFFFKDGDIQTYDTPEKISSVLDTYDSNIIVIGESGILNFDYKLEIWESLHNTPDKYITKDFRSNDGIKIKENLYIYGVMKKSPEDGMGAIIVCNQNKCRIVDEGIAIPNSFIHLPNSNEILISDSFKQKVHVFTFNVDYSKVISKSTWLDMSNMLGTPDGGCLVGKSIYLAIWGAAKVLELDFFGNIQKEHALPMLNPTDCASKICDNSLFITSAYEGMSEEQKIKYPLSGHTVKVGLNA